MYNQVREPEYVIAIGGCAHPMRSPSFINLTALREMCIGQKLADLVVVLGAVDIVMGEVDR
jgi:NADH:ubiquinone oxidoreductase subunit D